MADYSDKLMLKAITTALTDDPQMLKFLVGKLIGTMPSPIKPTGDSPAEMLRSIIAQTQINGVGPGDAAGLVEVIRLLTPAIELEDVQKEIKKLKKKAKKNR